MVTAPGEVPALLSVGVVGQVLDVLIDNARVHGAGDLALEVIAGDPVTIRVSDQGPRTFGAEIFRRGFTSRDHDGGGSGIGLAVAAEFAESVGAHLALDETSPTTTFTLLLPTGGPEQASSEVAPLDA